MMAVLCCCLDLFQNGCLVLGMLGGLGATACIIGICCGLPCDSAIAADFDLLWSKNGVNFFKVWPAHTIQLFNYEIHTINSNIIVLILPGHIGLSKPKQKTGSKKKSALYRIIGVSVNADRCTRLLNFPRPWLLLTHLKCQHVHGSPQRWHSRSKTNLNFL